MRLFLGLTAVVLLVASWLVNIAYDAGARAHASYLDGRNYARTTEVTDLEQCDEQYFFVDHRRDVEAWRAGCYAHVDSVRQP